jgi:polyisoprenoid-binding protein YceI
MSHPSFGACLTRRPTRRRGCDKGDSDEHDQIQAPISASLDTGNRRRDEHLRSADFFDIENHPQVRFVSESVQLQGDTLKVHGRLTARDRSIPVELDAEVHEAGGELEIEATTTAPHRDLEMTYSPLGMIPPRSKLIVKAHLVADTARAA